MTYCPGMVKMLHNFDIQLSEPDIQSGRNGEITYGSRASISIKSTGAARETEMLTAATTRAERI
jgi:hypothetical protein